MSIKKKAVTAFAAAVLAVASASATELLWTGDDATLGDGKVIKEKFVFPQGQFWADEKDSQQVECAFAKSDLPDDWRTSVKFSAAPRDSFGKRGRGIE